MDENDTAAEGGNMGRDIGVDLGTSTLLVYMRGKGIVLSEPSVVAIDTKTNKPVKIGREAYAMIGRTPADLVTVRPMRDGVISQYDVTLKMLQYCIRRACGPRMTKSNVMVCVPSGITEVEERAVVDAAIQAGSKRTYLIEEPMAAAIGAGLPVGSATGHMIVDIGGGTTDIAVLSLHSLVVSASVKMGGDKMNDAITRYIRRVYNLLIGERTAEEVKLTIGTTDREDSREMEVKGRCLIEGLPKAVTVRAGEIAEAMEEPIGAIVDAVRGVIEKIPPGLVADVMSEGIVMTGGGSLLNGWIPLLERVTGIPVRVAENPSACVVLGTGKAVAAPDAFRLSAIGVSGRQRRI